MYATDDESTLSESGYTTPPLSPTKTISTEGWLSPRSPESPRKSRSCLFLRDIGHELEDAFSTPPPSPTKPKFPAQLGTLSIPEVFSPTCDLTSPDLTDDSPIKRGWPLKNNLPAGRSLDLARFANRSLPAATSQSEATKSLSTPSLDSSRLPPDDGTPKMRRRGCRSSSEASIDALVAKYATPPMTTPEFDANNIDHSPERSVHKFRFPVKLGNSFLRSSSSPLRPSQWASRGGLLSSPRKSQSRNPDRFIHCRRPPAITRESFELSRPTEREQISHRGHSVGGADPFSHRVRRSDRLNAELQGLREAHTVIAGGSVGSSRDPNLRLRSSSRVTAARQISAGAVWNVGGSSAVSATVTAVSTGSGGMLGSGTMAPLYTSTFLNRADPEAELEAYERRLALALEVDQRERILQHSSLSSERPGTRPNTAQFYRPHVWRDSAWVQDSVKPR